MHTSKGYGEREREREREFFWAKMNAPLRGMEREKILQKLWHF